MMAMPVAVIEATPQSVPLVIEAVGQAEGSKVVEVRARVSGILIRQQYREGDRAKAGAPLFSIDRTPFEIALAQARAALAQDRANLERARREATRLKPLAEQRAISQKEYDDAASTLKTAQASAMASEARVRDAELNLSYTNVTAPIAGVTGRALRSEGSLIAAGTDASLLTTLNVTDPVWIRFSLSESEALQVRTARARTGVQLALGDGSVYARSGKLNFEASTVDTTTGAVQMRAEFPNPGLVLLPGQFVRVRITSGEREAFLVPQPALSQSDQGKVVFTVSPDNKVVPKPVETAGWAGQDWVVTSGLAAGDRIIVDNIMKLRPGATVAPHPPGQGPGAATAGSAPASAEAPKGSGRTGDEPAQKP
jgi:membrane fusion protein (multidrug efflux system)